MSVGAAEPQPGDLQMPEAVARFLAPLATDLEILSGRVRERATALLREGAAVVIGHRQAWTGWHGVPHFARRPEQAAELIAGPVCGPGLAKYLLDELPRLSPTTPAVLVARGCDLAGLRRLVADHRVAPELVHVLAIPCAGRIDERRAGVGNAEAADGGDRSGLRGLLAAACQECRVRRPGAGPDAEALAETGAGTATWPRAEVIGEDLPALGEWIHRLETEPASASGSLAASVSELARLDSASRMEYWSEWFSRCIRCNACRAACPACHCETCVLESDPTWLGRSTGLPEQFAFHFVRAMDVAGRCVGCGQCERACPAGLPLGQLWSKVAADVGELFGVGNPFSPSAGEPLGTFDPADPDPGDPGDPGGAADPHGASRRRARRKHG